MGKCRDETFSLHAIGVKITPPILAATAPHPSTDVALIAALQLLPCVQTVLHDVQNTEE